VPEFTKSQLRGLEAVSRGEMTLTLTGEFCTIIGPAGSTAYWNLWRGGFIAEDPNRPRQPKAPMVLTETGRQALVWFKL
jgi:hypothetical protein